MKRSKRIEVLDQRPVNKDGFIDEWPEMGFVSMHSPYDPKPSVKIEDGIITELDGKKRDEFDFVRAICSLDGINISSVDLTARKLSLSIRNIAKRIYFSVH